MHLKYRRVIFSLLIQWGTWLLDCIYISDEVQSNLRKNKNIKYNYDVDKTVFVAPPFMGSDMAYLAIFPKSIVDGYILYTKAMMYKDMLSYLFSSPNTFLIDPYMPYKATKEICFWMVDGPSFEDQYEAFFGLNGKPTDQLECGGFGVLRGAEDEGLKELMPDLLITNKRIKVLPVRYSNHPPLRLNRPLTLMYLKTGICRLASD